MTKEIQTWAIVWVKDEKDDIDGVCSDDGKQGFLTSLGEENWEWLVNTRRAVDGLDWGF